MNATDLQVAPESGSTPGGAMQLNEQVREYWNRHMHDGDVSAGEPGSERFFRELESYRREKLAYLHHVVDFTAFAGQDVLEIGCGMGHDLVRFAKAGARPVGVDVSERAIALAVRRFHLAGQRQVGLVADGTTLPFSSMSFDFVYSHGVLPYVADPAGLVLEAYRVLRKGGTALFMTYHRRSWLNVMRRLGGVQLAHADAPVLRIESREEFERSLQPFEHRTLVTERFPVPTRMRGGWKASIFNRVLVPMWRFVPQAAVRPFGWHLLAFCRKHD